MLIAVLVVFTACWLPDILVQLIRMIDSTVIHSLDLNFVTLFTVTITFLNNAVNPFLYIVMSR